MKKTLSNKEIRTLNEEIEKYGFSFEKKELVEMDENYIGNKEGTMFFKLDGKILPTLKLLLKKEINIKTITVDMGAVKFVTNGADIMRPGIVHIEDEIEEGDFVRIVDETHHKPLAIGKVLFNSEQMRAAVHGKVIENVHYIGDEIWNL